VGLQTFESMPLHGCQGVSRLFLSRESAISARPAVSVCLNRMRVNKKCKPSDQSLPLRQTARESYISSLPKSSFPSSMKLMITTTVDPARPTKNITSRTLIAKTASSINTIVACFRPADQGWCAARRLEHVRSVSPHARLSLPAAIPQGCFSAVKTQRECRLFSAGPRPMR